MLVPVDLYHLKRDEEKVVERKTSTTFLVNSYQYVVGSCLLKVVAGGRHLTAVWYKKLEKQAN